MSPHLDDAVFACGNLIAAHPAATVITVFAGRPPRSNTLSDWDRASGFTGGDDVIAARREEDRSALMLLGAKPLWLDFLDVWLAWLPGLTVCGVRLLCVKTYRERVKL